MSPKAPGEPLDLLGRTRSEVAGTAGMKGNEIHEGTALTRECSELRRLLGTIVDSAQHHVLERHSPIEDLRGFDYARERVLGVDGHQRLPQIIIRRVNRDCQPELLRAFTQCDD